MKNEFQCKLRVNKLTLPYEAFTSWLCASTGRDIDLLGEKKNFPREEKNGVDETKVFVPKGQEDGKC